MIKIFSHYVHRSTLRGIAFDASVVFLMVMVALMLQPGSSFNTSMPLAGTHALSLSACLFLVNSASGLYERSPTTSFGHSCMRAFCALLVLLPLSYAIFAFLPGDLGKNPALQVSAMAGMTAVVLRRVYLAHWQAVQPARTRILIFGAGSAAEVVGQTLGASDPNAHVVGYIPGPNEKDTAIARPKLLEMRGSLLETARSLEIDEIVVALTERRAGSMPLRQLLDCKLSGIKVYDLNTHFEKTLGQIRVDFLNASWLIFGDGFNQGELRTFIKRVFDIACASLLLLVSAPIMLVAAVAIRLDSPGPLLYRQERVGLDGRTFKVIKFRSMRTDAEKDGKPRWASNNDDRVTRVGHVIRRLRVDELPQIFNVLKGEMSLVGPRPERPFFVDQLTQEIPFFAVRHSVKPGVTGWAQVRYQYGATVEDSQEKLQYDLYYVKNHTLFLDLVVLFETVGVVLTGKGAR
ncbi:exopolysaccharide biosynthesis polyprenyl glycosylphosphotransferase [beta proteobacterium AAP51]|nr:exopolysaccharide biosynthesis polyprenyl glycosylphosphotransferase [beta proteobacterium AAP51]